MSIVTGSLTPLSAAHWYIPAWCLSTFSKLNVELSDKCFVLETASYREKENLFKLNWSLTFFFVWFFLVSILGFIEVFLQFKCNKYKIKCMSLIVD